MIVVSLCDPVPSFPEYDFQTWYFLGYDGWQKQARRIGEWAWVGRVREADDE